MTLLKLDRALVSDEAGDGAFAQGPLFGPPVEGDQVSELLRAGRVRTGAAGGSI